MGLEYNLLNVYEISGSEGSFQPEQMFTSWNLTIKTHL